MPACPACSADVPETLEVCPRCATPLSWSDAVTRAAETAELTPGASSRERRTPKTPRHDSSGWLTSTDAIDHGRFPPGTILDGRYRIVGRLGRGGMGEVYRADDRKLGQPVALRVVLSRVEAVVPSRVEGRAPHRRVEPQAASRPGASHVSIASFSRTSTTTASPGSSRSCCAAGSRRTSVRSGGATRKRAAG